jgi:hypothetical protein
LQFGQEFVRAREDLEIGLRDLFDARRIGLSFGFGMELQVLLFPGQKIWGGELKSWTLASAAAVKALPGPRCHCTSLWSFPASWMPVNPQGPSSPQLVEVGVGGERTGFERSLSLSVAKLALPLVMTIPALVFRAVAANSTGWSQATFRPRRR